MARRARGVSPEVCLGPSVAQGSDYPHGNGVWPESPKYIKEQFGHLPAATVRKIACENAGKFYGLIKSPGRTIDTFRDDLCRPSSAVLAARFVFVLSVHKPTL
jgi:hypothetical protein